MGRELSRDERRKDRTFAYAPGARPSNSGDGDDRRTATLRCPSLRGMAAMEHLAAAEPFDVVAQRR